jgi:hypothetical protein
MMKVAIAFTTLALVLIYSTMPRAQQRDGKFQRLMNCVYHRNCPARSEQMGPLSRSILPTAPGR